MQHLIRGLHRFQSDFFTSRRELYQRLAQGQTPEVLFITCSDSRVSPTLVTQTEPGQLFILRNAGNIVPPAESGTCGEAATIEYAVAVLKVKDIIICGHSHCGAMAGLMTPERLEGLPHVQRWLEHAAQTRRILEGSYGHLTGEALLTAMIQENVLVQLENLRTHPVVEAALARGELNLHGWVYEFETGEIYAYDPAQEAFVDLTPGDPPGAGGVPGA